MEAKSRKRPGGPCHFSRRNRTQDAATGSSSIIVELHDRDDKRVLRALPVSKEWADPRIHGCIVCASLSCPNLRGEAYEAARLSEQMDEQCTSWLSNSTKVRPGRHVSCLFKITKGGEEGVNANAIFFCRHVPWGREFQ